MKPLLLFGTGDIAELAHYYFTHDSGYDVVTFTVDGAFLEKDTFCDLPVVPFEEVADRYHPSEHDLFVATSYARMNDVRRDKVAAAKRLGYNVPSYISSKATIFPDLSDRENCFILEDNTIQPFVTVGHNVTMWSGNHIGHHSVVEDNTFLTSHVVVSGGVRIGKNCFVGVNATLRDHIELADYTLVAAGTLVNKNTEAYGVYMGVPGKKAAMSSTSLKI